MANFKVASVFSNHMVMQRDKNIRVFGKGESGKIITVTLGENKVSTVVEKERWMAILPPMKATINVKMSVACDENIREFINIAIGEVWLAGGQSNMELELQNAKDGKEILKTDLEPNVRFYYTPKNGYKDDRFYEAEKNSSWSEWSEENAKCWSAVGYFFARNLAKDLGVTIGIIGCNWGGTSASTWMSQDLLSQDKDLNTYLKEYDNAIQGKTILQQEQEYDEYTLYAEAWDKKCQELCADNPSIAWNEIIDRIGECKWPGPLNFKNPYRPSGLYDCMLQRLCPYTIRGVLWYQGESDDHKPHIYYRLFSSMINQWRKDWDDIELPFLFVQLPMHRYEADPDYKNWCYIREAQMNVFKTIKNTGIAVVLDCGEFNEIHPKDKLPVGERLELQALYHVYHKNKEQDAFGPIYKESLFRKNEIELSFEYATEGFLVKGKNNEFEIAGADKKFRLADVEIRDDKIVVSSPNVKNPLYVRYCWTNYGNVSIFGKNGIPLAPFRTSKNDEELLP